MLTVTPWERGRLALQQLSRVARSRAVPGPPALPARLSLRRELLPPDARGRLPRRRRPSLQLWTQGNERKPIRGERRGGAFRPPPDAPALLVSLEFSALR